MKKDKLQYCIRCEEADEVLPSMAGDFHYVGVTTNHGPGVVICYGPFASTEPQRLPVGWEDQISEPPDYDLAISNLRAKEITEGPNFEIDLAISNLMAVQLLEDFNQ